MEVPSPPGGRGVAHGVGHGLAAVGTLPYLVAGILLVSGSDAGLDWLFSGIVGAIIAGVVNGWVLLVEILR